jgi:hypothetical protein
VHVQQRLGCSLSAFPAAEVFQLCCVSAAVVAGKRVKVEPLAGVATPHLKQLLSALLQVVQGSSSPGGTPSGTRPGTPMGDAPGTAFSNNVVSYGSIRVSDDVSNGAGAGLNKVSAMMSMDRCVKMQALVVAARACIAPHIRAGNAACQGRCGCVELSFNCC